MQQMHEAPASNGTSSTAPRRVGRRQRVPQALTGRQRSLAAAAALPAKNTQRSPTPSRVLLQSGISEGSDVSSPAPQPALLLADVRIIPPYPPASYPQLARQLGNASAIADPGLRILGVLGISKQGIAGNGVCELGELPTANNTGAPRAVCASLRQLAGPCHCSSLQACPLQVAEVAQHSVLPGHCFNELIVLQGSGACMQGCPRTARWHTALCRCQSAERPAAAAARPCTRWAPACATRGTPAGRAARAPTATRPPAACASARRAAPRRPPRSPAATPPCPRPRPAPPRRANRLPTIPCPGHVRCLRVFCFQALPAERPSRASC